MKPLNSFVALATIVIFSVVNAQNSVAKFTLPSSIKENDYLPKTIIFKVKPQLSSSCNINSIANNKLNDFFASVGANRLSKKFPYHKSPRTSKNEKGEKHIDLSLIYSFSYNSDQSLEKIINKLLSTGMVEYAEPHYIPHIVYDPNDPGTGTQYHLNNIAAYTGWDISKGDTNVVIGITDTGTEYTHSDLKNNIKYNYADPINGADDDGDGYIDNYQGWDVGMDDNDASWQVSPHGLHVSGCSSASTDNNNGVAGTGFKCKFLPVKISDASGVLNAAYEGIVYAADHGCSIINCSWGNTGGGQYGQDIINYATLTKNALVIAAAGNNGKFMDFYPAAYNYVISVAATNSNDIKASLSNYAYSVDVSAPGENIYATWTGSTYSTQNGTSMASPITAGVAAIIKSHFPGYTALQVGERLKVTCDNIYPLNSATYKDKLGNGRINLYKALTALNAKSVVMTDKRVTDNNDDVFVVNDTLRISCDYTNYLDPTTNLTATLSSTSTSVSIIKSTTNIGALNTLDVANNNSDPFKVKILPSALQNESILFKLTLNDGTYTSEKYFYEIVNLDYINIAINDVGTTITSKGKIGYNNDDQKNGIGFTYKGTNLLYSSSLMIGNSASVSDMAGIAGSSSDVDFQTMVNVSRKASVVSEFDVEGKFTDLNAPAPLNLMVTHNAYAWSTPGNTKFIIVKYKIKNTGSTGLNNLHAGIFADWDIMNYDLNKASYDTSLKMGYAWSTETNGVYAGVKLLSNTLPIHYAVDYIPGGSGGLDLYNGYSEAEKYSSLSTNKANAGNGSSGNDIVDVTSTGPFNLNPGDTTIIAFAILAGDNLPDLKNSAINAQTKYDGMILGISNYNPGNKLKSFSVYPNPVSENVNVSFMLPESGKVRLNLYNVVGKEVQVILNENLNQGAHQFHFNASLLKSGIYYLRLEWGNEIVTGKLTVIR